VGDRVDLALLHRRDVIGVRKDLAGTVKSAADLKGRKIGVTAPGSSTSLR
jgi:ABC-type nitrate/sulfonate/bicarbonate transport system substrate-binding protein